MIHLYGGDGVAPLLMSLAVDRFIACLLKTTLGFRIVGGESRPSSVGTIRTTNYIVSDTNVWFHYLYH